MERNKPLILVVEDDRQIQKFICYALESEGYPYITARTGQEAISRLMSEQAEIMLLDLDSCGICKGSGPGEGGGAG